MFRLLLRTIGAILACLVCAFSQDGARTAPRAAASQPVPVYRVTVVEHGLDAVNYQYHGAPTKVDFRGTVLLPDAKGEASVQSRTGSTQIDAKFENLLAPTRFGRAFLTYVLWAISPEGGSRNLGEIVPDASNRARVRVTTSLQTFGMIVTAEPYSTVRQPGDVVVLENRVRPDTAGKIEPIQPKSDLMPRGTYTWQLEQRPESPANSPKVSMAQYEALLELYQAQNAIAIARAENAEHYAPEALAAAERALSEAQRLQSTKGNAKLVVQNAREAAQTADDARTTAERRKLQEKPADARAEASRDSEPPR